MSHMTQISVVIKDMAALEAACNRLGLNLCRTKKEARYYGHNTKQCEAVIEVPTTAYDIGVVKYSDGSYRLEFDSYDMEGRQIEKKCGKGLGLLLQAYAAEKTKKEARIKGFTTTEERVEDGTLRLRLRRAIA